MIIKDCIEGFLCYKEKVQCVYIKSMKRPYKAPLSVVAFVFIFTHPDNVVQGKLSDLVLQVWKITLILEK